MEWEYMAWQMDMVELDPAVDDLGSPSLRKFWKGIQTSAVPKFWT